MSFGLSRELDGALERLNALRAAGRPSDGWALAEDLLDALFETRSRLAVYGTLAPGAPNHSVIAELGGTWEAGTVRGEFVREGWAASAGFPAIRWRPGAPPIEVRLLTSAKLRGEWDRLDDFEGTHYRRILVPVERGSELLAVANLYEIREAEG